MEKLDIELIKLLAEQNHKKSEMINKNVEIISENAKKIAKVYEDEKTNYQKIIEFQEVTIKSQSRTINILIIPILLKILGEIINFF